MRVLSRERETGERRLLEGGYTLCISAGECGASPTSRRRMRRPPDWRGFRRYICGMLLALAVALGAMCVFVVYKVASKHRTRPPSATAHDTTPALDQFLRESLEEELASRVLGFANSTAEERANLRRTLAHEPDPDVVGKIEELVKAVELEFVRYAHEPDVEATVRVRFEDGGLGVRSRRLSLAEVPAVVVSDLETKKATRVFRTWAFPWQRAVAL
jgi:hypothetical protein